MSVSDMPAKFLRKFTKIFFERVNYLAAIPINKLQRVIEGYIISIRGSIFNKNSATKYRRKAGETNAYS